MPEEEVVVVEGAPDTGGSPAVTVDLNAKPEPKVESKIPPEVQAQIDQLKTQLTSMNNQVAGARRINEKLTKEVETLRTTGVRPPVASAVDPNDPQVLLDNGNWQKAVDVLAEKKVNTILEQRDAMVRQQQMQEAATARLNASKQSVVSLYTELDPESGDPESDVSKLYVQVLNENPHWLQNEEGPRLAMYEMERRLPQIGLSPRSLTPASSGRGGLDAARAARATSASLPAPRAGSKATTFTLDRDQKALCDTYGVPYEDYAKIAKALEANEGIST